MGVFLGDKLVFRGAIDREMFYMDIEELIHSRFRVAEPTSVEEIPVVAWNGGVDPYAAQVPLSCLGNKASVGITSKVVKEIHWLHKRMGHPSRNVMMKNVKRNSWNGVPPGISPRLIDNTMRNHECTACRLAKDNKLARKEGSGVKPARTGEVLSCDSQFSPVTTKARSLNRFAATMAGTSSSASTADFVTLSW